MCWLHYVNSGSNWVTMESGHCVEKPETPNDPRLKILLMICAKASNRYISRNMALTVISMTVHQMLKEC